MQSRSYLTTTLILGDVVVESAVDTDHVVGPDGMALLAPAAALTRVYPVCPHRSRRDLADVRTRRRPQKHEIPLLASSSRRLREFVTRP